MTQHFTHVNAMLRGGSCIVEKYVVDAETFCCTLEAFLGKVIVLIETA